MEGIQAADGHGCALAGCISDGGRGAIELSRPSSLTGVGAASAFTDGPFPGTSHIDLVFDLECFQLDDMYRCAAELRALGRGAASAADAMKRVVSYLFEQFRSTESGAPACSLVRLFQTTSWGALSDEARAVLRPKLESEPTSATPCLALRASRGVVAEWNDPEQSRNHRFLPLSAASAPMVSALIAQLGLSTEAPFILGTEDKLCNVFYVDEAADSPFVPAQIEFVRPYRVRSVLGFGGLLPENEIFVVILFCNVHVARETAELFRLVAPSVGLALVGARRDARSLEYRLTATEELLRHHERIALFQYRQQEEFISVASHELRTPLTVLQLAVQLLLSAKVVPGESHGPPSLQTIERATRRLTNLAEELLDVTTGGMSRGHLNLEDVQLSGIVEEVIQDMQGSISRSGSDVIVHSSGPAAGHWDRERLKRVVSNLLSNAIKFGSGKPIEITIDDSDEERVRMSVQDHGIGIPLSEQAHVFERFRRAVSERHYGGFGLGLWVARDIVEAHDGTIRLASEPGAGSTFTMVLPRSGPSHLPSKPMQ